MVFGVQGVRGVFGVLVSGLPYLAPVFPLGKIGIFGLPWTPQWILTYLGAIGFWILDSGFWILDPGVWSLEFGFWSLDSGLWILDFDSGVWILDSGSWGSWLERLGESLNRGAGEPGRAWHSTRLYVIV